MERRQRRSDGSRESQGEGGEEEDSSGGSWEQARGRALLADPSSGIGAVFTRRRIYGDERTRTYDPGMIPEQSGGVRGPREASGRQGSGAEDAVSARTMGRFGKSFAFKKKKKEMSERWWLHRRAKWQRASLGNQEEREEEKGQLLARAECGAHPLGRREKEGRDVSTGWKARRLGGPRCVREGGLTAGGALRADRQTDTSLGWTTERPGQRAVLWMDSMDALPLE